MKSTVNKERSNLPFFHTSLSFCLLFIITGYITGISLAVNVDLLIMEGGGEYYDLIEMINFDFEMAAGLLKKSGAI